MISKGGPVASEVARPSAVTTVEEEDKLKSFTFKIYESGLAQIRTIQVALLEVVKLIVVRGIFMLPLHKFLKQG